MRASGATMIVNVTVREKLAILYRNANKMQLANHHRGLSHYERGKLAWRENQVAPALAEFEKAAELLDNHAHTWFYLAEARQLQNDDEGAREAYKRCLDIDPDHGRALRRLAQLDSSD
jgi:tetratricopeptide (TPR) repeat protein